MNHTDVLIVGGGVIGLTTAYYLARRGVTVKLLDRGILGAEASWAGAGIIPPGNLERASTPMDQLRARSSQVFPDFSQELSELTGADNGYRRCGGIEFLESDEQHYVDEWNREGIPHAAISSDDFLDRFPAVHRIGDLAYHFPTMAQVRNPWHLKALIAACIVKRVLLRPKLGFTLFKTRNEQITGVRLPNWETLSADHYVIAAGAWSGQILHDLGWNALVKPVRGQMVLFRCERPILKEIVTCGKQYLVPREDGYVLCGSTEEYEAGFIKETTESGIQSLLDFAYRVVPSLRNARIEMTWAGLRPGSVDGIPILGRVPNFRNLFVATGHFRSGIQLSPGTAELISQMICSEETSIPMDFFRLDRPLNTSFTPAFRS